MARRKRRKFTAQFKADAVRLVMTGGKSVGEVTKQFDLTETALREWVRRAEIDAGKGLCMFINLRPTKSTRLASHGSRLHVRSESGTARSGERMALQGDN